LAVYKVFQIIYLTQLSLKAF